MCLAPFTRHQMPVRHRLCCFGRVATREARARSWRAFQNEGARRRGTERVIDRNRGVRPGMLRGAGGHARPMEESQGRSVKTQHNTTQQPARRARVAVRVGAAGGSATWARPCLGRIEGGCMQQLRRPNERPNARTDAAGRAPFRSAVGTGPLSLARSRRPSVDRGL